MKSLGRRRNVITSLGVILIVLGLMAGCQEAEHKYVSVNSNIYHYSSCRWTERINPENEIWFTSVEDAKLKGYRACKVCKPPRK